MVRVAFTQLDNSYNEKNMDYFKKAREVAEKTKELIEEKYTKGSITLNLAIPHRFFHVTEISSDLESSLPDFVKYNFDEELNNWII